MGPAPVDRNPENFRVELLKFRQDLVVKRQLIRADGAPICGIKSENDRASFEIAETDPLIRGAVQGKIGRFGSRGQDCFSFSC